jgi:hypothetical protein
VVEPRTDPPSRASSRASDRAHVAPTSTRAAGPGGIAGALEHRRDCVDTPCAPGFGRDMHLSLLRHRELRGFGGGGGSFICSPVQGCQPHGKACSSACGGRARRTERHPSTNGAASAAAQNSASQASRLPACEPKNPSEGHVHQPFRTSADGIQVATVQYRERITEHSGGRERKCVTGRAWVMWARIRLYRSSGFGWLRALYAAAHPRSRRFTLPTLAAR